MAQRSGGWDPGLTIVDANSSGFPFLLEDFIVVESEARRRRGICGHDGPTAVVLMRCLGTSGEDWCSGCTCCCWFTAKRVGGDNSEWIRINLGDWGMKKASTRYVMTHSSESIIRRYVRESPWLRNAMIKLQVAICPFLQRRHLQGEILTTKIDGGGSRHL